MIDEKTLLHGITYTWFGISAVVLILLFFLTAPYGRHHASKGWGPSIPAQAGWLFMELPAVLVPILCMLLSTREQNIVIWLFLGIWLFHYIHRTFIYPFRMRMNGKKMLLLIASLAFLTNVSINYANFRWLTELGPLYPKSWLTNPRFLCGAAVFFVGFAINFHSDELLRKLRKPEETGYKIPKGGLYRWVSCPNYFGEILEWTGWFIATSSLPALAFLVWTISNLLPRAISHHRWYKETFDDYPSERKALIPYIL